MDPTDLLTNLTERLAGLGLRLCGGFPLDTDLDRDVVASSPGARSLLLVGNTGSEMWRRNGPAIMALGSPNPLDRWTRREIEPIATGLGGTAIFPFGGPPHWPFQRWAQRAEGVRASPLGILMHPVFGLWQAYRAAILLPEAIEFPERPAHPHPCDACPDRPCLKACPVAAFSPAGYAVDRCVAHVRAGMAVADGCFQRGCLARMACPIGPEWRHDPDHAQFHMQAFLSAHSQSLN